MSTKIAKDELFDYFIYEFIVYDYFSKLLEHSKYSIILPYSQFLNFEISVVLRFVIPNFDPNRHEESLEINQNFVFSKKNLTKHIFTPI